MGLKILLVSQTADGLGLAQRLVFEGHSVAAWIKNSEYEKSGEGIVQRIESWRSKVAWSDLVIFDMVGMGDFEPTMQRMAKPYLCCSPLMDVLELDRGKGMGLFRHLGIEIPPTTELKSVDELKGYLEKEEFGDGICVKPDGNIGTAKTFLVKDKEEIPWVMSSLESSKPAPRGLIVQRIVKGVEVSTEAWFNGRDFIRPFNHTFEEKRFMDGGLGPNTGCMGNVVIATGPSGNKLTKHTVERLLPFLRKVGWRGPVDVNCIVNEKGAFALEATCRFGYDAIEAFTEGLQEPLADFLFHVAVGTAEEMKITSDPMIAVRLVVSPYPMEDVKQKDWGQPILGLNKENLKHLFLCNVFLDGKDGMCKVAPADGVVLKATARGRRKGPDLTTEARDRVYRTLENVRIPGKMYRTDIGKRVNGDWKQLEEWGWV